MCVAFEAGRHALRLARCPERRRVEAHVIHASSISVTTKAVREGQALEANANMEYVWERTKRVVVNEELTRGLE